MSQDLNGDPRADEFEGRLVVVRVEDAIEPKLAARAGASYESPPQPREQAMVLVALLLGHKGEALNGGGRWMVPIAGGRRVVTLSEEPIR